MVCESLPGDEEFETYIDDTEYEKFPEYQHFLRVSATYPSDPVPTNEELSFWDEQEREETSICSALDLRPREYEKMDQFFSKEKGKNKVLFANKYVKMMQTGAHKIPEWIKEIKQFFNA